MPANTRAPFSRPYDDGFNFQCFSKELVIYSPLVEQFVTIAWPSIGGIPIIPSDILTWLHSHGLHWSCFCGLVTKTSMPSCIAEVPTGDVLVLCHENPSKYGFSINLSAIYQSSVLRSDYDHLPTVASGHQPCMMTLLSTFLLETPDLSGPYFAGYCGEHVVDFPDSIQLSRKIRLEEIEISGPQVISRVIYGPESFSTERDEFGHQRQRRAQMNEDAAQVSLAIAARQASRSRRPGETFVRTKHLSNNSNEQPE